MTKRFWSYFVLFTFGFRFATSLWGGEILIRTQYPSEAQRIYYILKTFSGKVLSERRVVGRQSHQFTSLPVPLSFQGAFRLLTSYGQFRGSWQAGQLSMSHPHLEVQANQITIRNRYTLTVRFRSNRPPLLSPLRFHLLSSFGMTKQAFLTGKRLVLGGELKLRHILPGYAHLSTPYGQFVIQVGENGRVYFVYQGARKERRLETWIDGGQTRLTLEAEVSTLEENLTSPRKTPSSSSSPVRAIFHLPQEVEAKSPRGTLLTLDGSPSLAPPKARFYWMTPQGLREGKQVSLWLPLGRHQIRLTVTAGNRSHSLRKTVAVVDRTPPELEFSWSFAGPSLFELRYHASDLVDSAPVVELELPLNRHQLQQAQWKKGSVKVTLGERWVFQAPQGQTFWAPYLRRGKLFWRPVPQYWKWTPRLQDTVLSWQRERMEVEGLFPSFRLVVRDASGNEQIFPLSPPELSSQRSVASSEKPLSEEEKLPSPFSLWEVLLSLALLFLGLGALFLPWRSKDF